MKVSTWKKSYLSGGPRPSSRDGDPGLPRQGRGIYNVLNLIGTGEGVGVFMAREKIVKSIQWKKIEISKNNVRS